MRLFRVRVVDVNPESLTIEATGAEGKESTPCWGFWSITV